MRIRVPPFLGIIPVSPQIKMRTRVADGLPGQFSHIPLTNGNSEDVAPFSLSRQLSCQFLLA